MTNRWILVDGYSVLHTWPRFTSRKSRALSLAQRREILVRLLGQYGDHIGRRVTIVFDGYAAKHKPDTAEPITGVEVVFSDRGKTADDIIERFVGEAERRTAILVVSSDNVERQTVEVLGAQSMSAELFETEVTAALEALASQVRHHGRRRRLGSVREHFEQ